MSSTLNVYHILFVIPRKILGNYKYIVLYYCHFSNNSSTNFQSSMTIFLHKLLEEKVGFCPMDELIYHP